MSSTGNEHKSFVLFKMLKDVCLLLGCVAAMLIPWVTLISSYLILTAKLKGCSYNLYNSHRCDEFTDENILQLDEGGLSNAFFSEGEDKFRVTGPTAISTE